MSDGQDFDQLHWLLSILQNIDIGLVVLDRDYRIRLWNGFMENHSNRTSAQLLGKEIFSEFPEISGKWLKKKVESVFLLNNRAFTTWQQRTHLLKFSSYRPITGESEWMYQNISILPLMALDGSIGHVCLIVYDVTDTAMDELALQRANKQLEMISRTDGLTGLLNRASWELEVEREFRRCLRYSHTSTLIMFDIDHFKNVNDNYGHPAGDEVIRKLASLISRSQRGTDLSGRYGGEEFGIVLTDTTIDGAHYFAERLRQRAEDLVITSEGKEIRLTISLGIAELKFDMQDHGEWITQADKALYMSKENGRNQISVYGQ
jgi:diguanylate cyclase